MQTILHAILPTSRTHVLPTKRSKVVVPYILHALRSVAQPCRSTRHLRARASRSSVVGSANESVRLLAPKEQSCDDDTEEVHDSGIEEGGMCNV